jgi:hypothetical protein
LVERLFRNSITFAGGLALLARFLAAALLLTGFLTRRLTVLAGLVLARHVVSFQGNIMTTAPSRPRSDKTKAAIASPPLCNFQPRHIRVCAPHCATSSHTLEFRYHHMNTQWPTNEQAGTEQLVTRAVGPAVKQTRRIQMSNETQNNSSRNNSHQLNGEKLLDTGAALASTFPSGFQAIATAYGDYTKKSFEDTKSYVEKLSGVRSLDKAIEIQTEFAKTAYETFVSESQKIGALYADLAKQSPVGGFLARMTPTNR